MFIKIFTLRFSDRSEGFDDESLRVFMADKEIVSIREEFFVKDNVPYWAVMITYKLLSGHSEVALKSQAEKEKDERKNEYRKYLTDENTPLFELLRQWRYEQALEIGLPRYMIFTNMQLAHIAAKMPENLEQLSSVEGVGKAKLKKYGDDVLTIIKEYSHM